jgi:3-phenylpropionate/trans-cinnamate dioxygenase ferredoxin reductase subunit
MARAVTPATSEFFLQAHQDAGTDVRLNVTARRIVARPDGHVGAVELADGTLLDADLVILGTGVTPNDELARDAGIEVDNGIITDAFLSTSDPSISAIGDCANVWHDSAGLHLRLESVQAAVDQAKCLAERLTGNPRPYRKAPWFWSDQGAHKLQIAGLSAGADHVEASGSAREGRLVVRAYRGSQQICVETVNAPGEHMQARRSLDERMLTQDDQLLNGHLQ